MDYGHPDENIFSELYRNRCRQIDLKSLILAFAPLNQQLIQEITLNLSDEFMWQLQTQTSHWFQDCSMWQFSGLRITESLHNDFWLYHDHFRALMLLSRSTTRKWITHLQRETGLYIPPNHLLSDRSPNIGPLKSLWELDKFKNCWNKSFRTSKILTLLNQQFSNFLDFPPRYEWSKIRGTVQKSVIGW
jgi:hypothetical protein